MARPASMQIIRSASRRMRALAEKEYFYYAISDGHGGTDVGAVNVSVSAGASLSASEEGIVFEDVLSNEDPLQDALTAFVTGTEPAQQAANASGLRPLAGPESGRLALDDLIDQTNMLIA